MFQVPAGTKRQTRHLSWRDNQPCGLERHHFNIPFRHSFFTTMAVPRRYAVIASSIFLVIIITISLITSIQIRASQPSLVQLPMAQAATDDQFEQRRKGGSINGSAFDRADILSGTSTVAASLTATWVLSTTPSPMTEDGMIGVTPTPQPTPTSADEGYIGPIESSPVPKPAPKPAPGPQIPILALSYAGDGGPKHCRGKLLQRFSLPPPASDWKNGTCVNLPATARCGVFYSQKGDNCEAQLFTMADCHNTTQTYINTVVFMPEERPVGAMWNSMYIRCGVDAPEPALIDPSILGGMLKKPGGG